MRAILFTVMESVEMTTTVGNSSGRISDVRSTSGLQHDVEGGCRCWGTKLPFIDASIFPFVQFGVSSLILPVVTHLSQCTHPSALDHHSNALALAQAESAKVICASLTIHAHIHFSQTNKKNFFLRDRANGNNSKNMASCEQGEYVKGENKKRKEIR